LSGLMCVNIKGLLCPVSSFGAENHVVCKLFRQRR